ncbi:MAG: YdcF family protein [Sphingomonadaceae bacterium]|jgi:uncharacterized SAM-binding protein YcdF (DUF218 family)
MIRRLLALLFLAWIFGFAWFAITLPGPAGAEKTDSAVVLTGGEGRILRGIEVVRKGWAPRVLISGVDKDVKEGEFAAEFDVPEKLMKCCVTLGYDAYDTRSNALETSRWLAENEFESVRLITTDWHIRRAALELDKVKPAGERVIFDAVSSEPSLRILFLEYHKWIARQLAWVWNG